MKELFPPPPLASCLLPEVPCCWGHRRVSRSRFSTSSEELCPWLAGLDKGITGMELKEQLPPRPSLPLLPLPTPNLAAQRPSPLKLLFPMPGFLGLPA